MKKKYIFILIIALVIIVIVGIILAWQKQTNQIAVNTLPKPSVKPTTTQLNLTYQYVGELPTFNKQITIYSTGKDEAFSSQEIQEYGQKFGFTNSSKQLQDISGIVYSFKQNDLSLSIFSNPPSLSYRNFTSPGSNKLSQKDLVAKAQEFLDTAQIIGKQVMLSTPYLQPIAGSQTGEGLLKTTMDQASYVEINYNLVLDKLPIIPKDRQSYPITLLLNLDGSIRKASLTIFTKELSSLGKVTPAEPAAALQAINAGGGLLSKFSNPNQAYTEIDSNMISTATLRSLELVYLYDYDTNTLQPYYRFSGTANTTSAELIEIEVLITALPQEVFQQENN
ncbi:hypothetical protein GYA49_02440 [Candidatus Beckwithbacteria bacterium]|nr:hypothetical protein [Candidatus Beckwithbacteria bacterium]